MNPVLPRPREAQMLLRLRALRVQRARTRCGRARAEFEHALHALHERTCRIERTRQALDALTNAAADGFAACLPRWGSMVGAQRDRLVDRLDGDEFELRAEHETLREAEQQLQAARAAFTHALAREDAVRDVARQTERALAHAHERRGERELEDQAAAPVPRQQGGLA